MTRSSRFWLLVTLGALLATVPLNFVWQFVWISPAFDGTVSGAVTRAPLARTIVVANWQIRGLEGTNIKQIAVSEVVTDLSGRFHFAA